MFRKFNLLLFLLLPYTLKIQAQGCCSGGAGSPVAGGTSQGVLALHQVETGLNFQYINSKKFLTGTKPAINFLDNFNTQYLYGRLAYGITDHLTMSVEAGYFINKSQVAINKKDKIGSRGFSDLIIFPRYKVYESNKERTKDEITLGLGYKIPIGKYLDSSVVYTDLTGKNFYTPLPPAVTPTTGSNDFIFYGFAFRGYPKTKFKIFTSLLYIRKGWNPIGEKFGDYASLGLFAGKMIFKNTMLTFQLKGEHIGKMKVVNGIDFLAIYNLDINSTGGNRLLLIPQLNYSYKTFSFYLLGEAPLYQFVNGTAIASQYSFTFGLSYRFMAFKNALEDNKE